MINLTKTLAVSLITASLAGYAFAGGDHEGQHAHDTNAVPAQGQATQGSPAASTCTPEHEKMGHCKMEQGETHEGESHAHMEFAVGKPAEMTDATKTLNVNLLDSMKIEFEEQPDIKDGDIVKFVITNQGKIPHEFSLGSAAEQETHREMMKQMPGMVHTDGNTITVQPGETQELAWQFTGKNQVVFACNIPGHFEGGMHHEVEVK